MVGLCLGGLHRRLSVLSRCKRAVRGKHPLVVTVAHHQLVVVAEVVVAVGLLWEHKFVLAVD